MNKQGFTLIELLVVVLIIGILAAIALPQYMKAVEKSRASEAIGLIQTVARAEKLYKLSNNLYTFDLEALDIEMPNICGLVSYVSNFEIRVSTVGDLNANADTFAIRAERTRENDKYYIIMRYENGKETMWCSSNNSDGMDNIPSSNLGNSTVDQLCKSIANGNPKGIIYQN